MRPSFALILLAALAAAPHAALGQRAALDLTVVEAGTGTPLAGVRVDVMGRHLSAVTDPRGAARITGIPAGIQYVQVQRMGYEVAAMPLELAAGDTLGVDVTLAPAPVALDTVAAEVDASRTRLRTNGFYDRQRVGLGKFRTREQLLPVQNLPLHVALSSSMPGLRVETHSGSGHDEHWLVSPRSFAGGGRACIMAIYLDGIRLSDNDIDAVSTEALEAVEVYNSAAEIPAEYNTTNGGSCGAVLLWTRVGG
ncbi:MAG: TonB-dependent receptor plug [Gemmatimonadetes bacterium]|nr:TonB-dependent receptor plug [Gemmatimonadota bacterium]